MSTACTSARASTPSRVDAGSRYDILIGAGLLGRRRRLAGPAAAAHALIVSNSTVGAAVRRPASQAALAAPLCDGDPRSSCPTAKRTRTGRR